MQGCRGLPVCFLLLMAAPWLYAQPKTAPTPPSICRIDCELKRTKDRPIAVLTMTYEFRTTAPRTAILLGGQKAFAVKASLDGGTTPVLESTTDGLVAIVDSAGEHTISVTLESAISPRGVRGDLGFEVGLPRAAITTLTLTAPGDDLKTVTLTTHGTDSKPVTFDKAKLAKSYPLGAVDSLDLAWEAPKSESLRDPTCDAEVIVRVDALAVETTATLTLRGALKDWTLKLPPGTELTGDATITRPAEASHVWKITTTGTDTVLKATHRQSRADPKETKSFSIGPFIAEGNVRQSGTVKVFAPDSLRITLRPGTDLRRSESADRDDTLVAGYRFNLLPAADRKTAAMLELDVRPATGVVVAQPNYKLALTALGWKLRCDFRITPVRMAVEQVLIDVPAGWEAPSLGPLDLVDDVSGGGDASIARRLTVRLSVPQREAFDLTLESRWPVPPETHEVLLPLPRIQARERDATLSVTVPESLELQGQTRETANGPLMEIPRVNHYTRRGLYDAGLVRVELTTQPFRPNVSAELKAEVTLGERQITIQEVIRIKFPEGAKSIRFTGPTGNGFRATPPLESQGPGEWLFLPSESSREAVISFSYALKLSDATRISIPLIVPEGAVQSTTRIWNANPLRRVANFEGPWREIPGEPSAEAFPALALESNATTPLTLDLAEADPTGSVVVERAAIQWWLGDNGSTQGRARYLLRRWPATLEIDPAGGSGVTAFADKARIECLTRGDLLRVSLPESKANRTLLLELRFSEIGDTLSPPRLRGAVYRQPLWWQMTPPAESLILLRQGALEPETRWRWDRFGFTPGGAMTDDALDRWLADGSESEERSTSLTARQATPMNVSVLRVPLVLAIVLTIVSSIALSLLFARLTRRGRAIVIALGILMAAGIESFAPMPARQMAMLLQPAIGALVVAGILRSVIRDWRARRIAAETTFSRSAPVSTAVPELGSRSRSSQQVVTP